MNIETQRLTLNNFKTSDWQALREIATDKDNAPFAFMDDTWPTDDEKIKEICSWFADGDQFLAVRIKQSDELIGFVCLNPDENPKARNIGYCIHSKHQSNGYAFEACKALIGSAFENFEIEKIVTGTGISNIPSVKLLEKLGFEMVSKEMAHFREDEKGNPMMFEAGSFVLTRERWVGNGRF